MAINDLVVHPRDNDLVLGTHSRGIWILDNVNALQERTDVAGSAHLFSMEPAEQIRYRSDGGHAGDAVFYGENPPAGAIIDYWLADATEDVAITIHDAAGEQIANVSGDGAAGFNRAIWNLRYAEPAADGAPGRFRRPGPLVVPGEYTVRLEANGSASEQPLEVREDPRIAERVSEADRRAWTETLLEIGELRRRAQALSRRVAQAVSAARDDEGGASDELTVLAREANEFSSRISRLEGEASGIVGPLTGEQATQWQYYLEMIQTLEAEAADIVSG